MLAKMFANPKPVIGRISLLPISLEHHAPDRILERAEQEALAWMSAGADGVLLENTHQPMQPGKVDTALIALMSLALARIIRLTQKPVGISLLDNHPVEAQQLAWTSGAAWVRVPVLTGCRVSRYGLLTGQGQALADSPAWLKLPMMVDISRNQWVSNQHHYPTDPLQAVCQDSTGADAFLLLASEANHAWLSSSRSFLRERASVPLWLLDDGQLLTVETDPRLAVIDGIVLHLSVLKRSTAIGGTEPMYPSIDPERALKWINAFKQL